MPAHLSRCLFVNLEPLQSFTLYLAELTNFCAGSTPNSQLQESIARENELHHDIVQGDFLDTYRNLSYKSIMGQLWASEFCEQVLIDTVRSVLTNCVL